MGVASLVLGIISMVIGLFLAGFQWVGAIVGLIGIILGAQARKNPEQAGMGKAGLVCSIIGFILCIILYVACVLLIGGLSTAAGYM